MQKSKIQDKIPTPFFKIWPLLFIIVIWFIFSSPYFLNNLIPFSSDYLVNFFPPWSSYQELASPVKNNAMPDIITQIYPWKKLVVESLRSGQIPLWNPYSFSGSPHLANYQSAVFSPFNILFFIFPFKDAWSLLILLQPLLAGFFTYLLVRSLNISKLGSSISSIVYMFCGFMVVWMAYGTLVYAVIYLPLSLFAIQSFINTKKIRYLVLLSITIPLSFFSGHFQISLYFLAASIAFLLLRMYKEKAREKFFLLASVLAGILLSMPQLLPSWEFYANSVRSATFILTEAIPLPYIITSFAPDFFGNAVTRNDWYGHYAEWASFVGIIPIVLSVFSFLKIKKEIVFFGILGIVSLLLSLQTPLSTFIVGLKIPVVSTSALSRIIVIFSFSMAVLAGFGMDTLREYIKKRKPRRIIWVLSVFILIVCLILGFAYLLPIMPPDKVLIARRNMILPALILVLGSLTVLAAFYFRKISIYILFGLLMLASFDSLRFAQKWMPFESKKLVYPDTAVVKAIQRETKGVGRVYGNIGGEATNYFRLPSTEGYDPLYIERYGEFLMSATDGHFVKAERSVAKLNRRGNFTDKALDILGIDIVFHPIADTNQGWAYPVWKDVDRFDLIYKDDKFQLFRNKEALGRAELFYNYGVEKDKEKIVEKLFSENFDFRNILVLEDDPGLIKSNENPKSHANIVSYEPNRVRIDVKTNKPAILFLSDNYYPGWKAYVDGNPTKILRADYTFRALAVPEGNYMVEFKFQPESFKYGLIMSGSGILIMIALWIFARKKYLL